MATALEIAHAFLSIGGRIMIDGAVGRRPRLASGLNGMVLFSLDLSEDEAARRMEIARAYDAASDVDEGAFLDLVREHGRAKDDRWIIWENPRTEWDRRLSVYQRARAYSDGLPSGDPAEDRAVDAYCDAMDRLVAVPAPDLSALAMKIDFMLERECFARDWLETFAADARRLHAEGR